MKCIVSFCNNKKTNGSKGLIGELQVNVENRVIEYSEIELKLPKEINPKGVTGLTYHGNLLIALIQSKTPYLVFLDKSYNIINIWSLNGFKGIHSICSINSEIYFAVTGNDSIIKTKDGKKFETVWETGEARDTIHLNSICNVGNDILFTAFGEKSNSNLWSSARNGFIYSVNRNMKLHEGVWHPHTLFYFKEKLFYCNSSLQQVECFDSKFMLDKFKGYTRGLYINDKIKLVGNSKGRLISHSTGKKISNISDKGLLYGSCGITAVFGDIEKYKYLSLDEYSSEIFDIILKK